MEASYLCPEGYHPILNVRQTEQAIRQIKEMVTQCREHNIVLL